jgi:hypothetical protein
VSGPQREVVHVGRIAPFVFADGQSCWSALISSFLYRSVKRQVGSVKLISIPVDKKFRGSDKSG